MESPMKKAKHNKDIIGSSWFPIELETDSNEKANNNLASSSNNPC
jgi:hypothetical protein